jgi:hypothetical protein
MCLQLALDAVKEGAIGRYSMETLSLTIRIVGQQENFVALFFLCVMIVTNGFTIIHFRQKLMAGL